MINTKLTEEQKRTLKEAMDKIMELDVLQLAYLEIGLKIILNMFKEIK